jgi:hypothetical protein
LREYSTIAAFDGLSIGTILYLAYVTYKLSTEVNITALLAIVGALPKGSAGESPQELKGTSGRFPSRAGPLPRCMRASLASFGELLKPVYSR